MKQKPYIQWEHTDEDGDPLRAWVLYYWNGRKSKNLDANNYGDERPALLEAAQFLECSVDEIEVMA